MHQVQFETSSRDEPVFDSACGANELYLGTVARAQLLGDGEGRDDVAAGTASRDDHAHNFSLSVV